MEVLNKNSSIIKLLMAGLPILLIVGLSTVYMMLDNHYRINLTESFTQQGISDENNVGIIFGDEHSDSFTDLNSLKYYKQLIIPYNQTSGDINLDVTEPKSTKLLGFYNEQTNVTNVTISNINSFSYENIENESSSFNLTQYNIYQRNTDNQSISKSIFGLQRGIINGTNEETNMTFNPAPPITWEDIYTGIEWYENWTPSNSFIGKTFSRLYIPFKGTPSSNALVYVQIYNQTTIFAITTLHQSDFYNPSYSIINVLDLHSFKYYGGVIQIKIWTNPNVNWWSPLQFATLTPNSTNSVVYDINTLLFGYPITTFHSSRSFYKGWVLEQNFTSNAIYSVNNGSNREIKFNLTFNLGDYGINAYNFVNFSVHINDLSYNLSNANFIVGYLSFYDFNITNYVNFTNGYIQNITYGFNSNNLQYIGSNSEIINQIHIIGHNQDFYMLLKNLTFNICYIETESLTNYYTTFTTRLNGILEGTLSLESNTISILNGYIYSELIIQHIQLNVTSQLITPFRTLTYNETIIIENSVNRKTIYYLYNNQNNPFDIKFNYYQPLIVFDKYIDESERVIIGLYDLKVLF